jgi:hypothetical protein
MIIMKKIITLVCFMAVVGVTAASAQVVWGGRVGLCYSTVDVEGEGSLSGSSGLEIGPVLYYALKENIYLNSGAMFSVKNIANTFDGETTEIDVYFLEVPLYAGFAFPLGGFDFYAQAGPYVGFKLKESWSVNGTKVDVGDDEIVGSFNAGLGFVGGININRFKIELGYQQGLTNVASTENKEADFNMTLGSMFIGVSYIF